MNIPPYQNYFLPMDDSQEKFYYHLEHQILEGNYVDIGDNHSYIFILIDRFLSNWKKVGFQNAYTFLEKIISLYGHEQSIYKLCRSLTLDCLLGLKKFEVYLEKTEPENIFGTLTHASNLRLNIQKHIGLKANPIDIALLFGCKRSKFTLENSGLYKDKIREVFENHGDDNGGWFNIIEKNLSSRTSFPHYLLRGLGFSGPQYWDRTELISEAILDFKILCFYTGTFDIKFLLTKAENLARAEMKVPDIGSCWISETILFKKLENEFSFTTVIQHGQPSWLGRQHFDIWLPDFNIAIEYHGKQHFEPVDFFGGYEGLLKTIERDKRKKELAEKNNVKLFVVTEQDDPNELVAKLLLEINKKFIKSSN